MRGGRNWSEKSIKGVKHNQRCTCSRASLSEITYARDFARSFTSNSSKTLKTPLYLTLGTKLHSHTTSDLRSSFEPWKRTLCTSRNSTKTHKDSLETQNSVPKPGERRDFYRSLLNNLIRGITEDQPEEAKKAFTNILSHRPNAQVLQRIIFRVTELQKKPLSVEILNLLILELLSRHKTTKNPNDFNTMIEIFCKNGDDHNILVTLREFKLINKPPPPSMIQTVLIYIAKSKMHGEKAVPIISELLLIMVRHNMKPTILFLSVALHAYSQTGDTEEMERLFHVMKELEIVPTQDMFCSIMSAYVHSLQEERALEHFEVLKSFNIEPDVHVYSLVLTAYIRTYRFESAALTFEEMVDKKCTIQSRHCFTLLHFLTTHGLAKQVNSDLEQLASELKNSFATKGRAYVLTDGEVEKMKLLYESIKPLGNSPQFKEQQRKLRSLWVDRKFEEIIQTVAEMKANGFRPDKWCYSILIASLQKLNKTEELKRVLEEMKILGIQRKGWMFIHDFPDAITHSNVREVMDKLKQLKEQQLADGETYEKLMELFKESEIASSLHHMELLFKDMIESNIKPTVKAFSLLMSCYGKQHREKLHQLFQDMTAYGLSPGIEIYNKLLRSLMDSGDIHNFRGCYSYMRRQNVIPNVETFDVLIIQSVKLSRFKEAVDHFNEMQQLGFTWNTVVCNVLLHALTEAHLPQHILPIFYQLRNEFAVGKRELNQSEVQMFSQLLKEVKKHSSADIADFNEKLSELMLSDDPALFEEGEKMFNEMKSKGLKPDTSTYNILFKKYIFLKQPNRVLLRYSDFIQDGLLPNIVTYGYLILAVAQVGGAKDAWKIYQQMKVEGSRPTLSLFNQLAEIVSSADISDVEVLQIHHELLNDMIGRSIPPHRNLVENLMIDLAKKGDAEGLLNFFTEMKSKGLLPTNRLCSVLINSFASLDDVEKMEHIAEDMKKWMLLRDGDTCQSMIQLYARKQQIGKCVGVLWYLLHHKIDWNVGHWRPFLNLLEEQNKLPQDFREISAKILSLPDTEVVESTPQLKALLQLFPSATEQDLREQQQQLNVKARDLLRNSQLNRAQSLLKEMNERRIPIETVTYNSLLRCLQRLGRDGEVVQYLTNKKRNFEYDPETYILLLESISRLPRYDMNKLSAIVEEMERNKLQPTVEVFSLIERIVAKQPDPRAHLEWMASLLEKMTTNKKEYDLPSLQALINTLSRDGNTTLLGAVYSQIKSIMNTADAEALNRIITSCAAHGDIIRMEEFLNEARVSGVSLKDSTQRAILNAYAQRQEVETCLSIAKLMEEQKVRLSAHEVKEIIGFLEGTKNTPQKQQLLELLNELSASKKQREKKAVARLLNIL